MEYNLCYYMYCIGIIEIIRTSYKKIDLYVIKSVLLDTDKVNMSSRVSTFNDQIVSK